MGVGLPVEYQVVEYLESTGTQYIETGILPSNSIGFECTFLTNNLISNEGYGCIFGSRYSGGNNDFQLTTFRKKDPPDVNYQGSFRFGRETAYDAGIVREIKQTIKMQNLEYFAGQQSTNISSYTWNSRAKEVYLFALNQNGTATQSGNGCRIYAFKFYNVDTVIMDLIPCYRKSDDKPGMYDLISDTFFINAGSGEFIVGDFVNISSWMVTRRRELLKPQKLPMAYQEVEYIATSGTQYINTGVLPTADGGKAHIKFLATSWTRYDNDLLCAFDGSRYYYAIIALRTHNVIAAWNTSNSSPATYTTSGTVALEEVTEITTILTPSQKTIKINNNQETFSGGAFANASQKPLYLFALNQNGTARTDYMFYGRLYECQIYTGDTLVRDFVPCYRKSDGEIGLYDMVTKTFFTNQGTGSFTKGNNKYY